MRAYARQAQDPEMCIWAAEIKLRAERRAGEMLIEMTASGKRQTGHGDQKSGSHAVTPKLSDFGITKMQSSRWQQEAAVPEIFCTSHIYAHQPIYSGRVQGIGDSADRVSRTLLTFGAFKHAESPSFPCRTLNRHHDHGESYA